jgi:hypothetical protein
MDVYARYIELVNGVYKPAYNWGSTTLYPIPLFPTKHK